MTGYEKLSSLLSAAAVIISIVALQIASSQSAESNRTAREALETARQSNAIALREMQSYARIAVKGPPAPLLLRSPDEIASAASEGAGIFMIQNNGRVPIAGVRIRIHTYQSSLVRDNDSQGRGGADRRKGRRKRLPETFAKIPPRAETIDFPEALLPSAVAHVDLTPRLASHLTNLGVEFAEPSQAYRVDLSVAVIPRTDTATLPVRSPESARSAEDVTIVSIRFVPQYLSGVPAASPADVTILSP